MKKDDKIRQKLAKVFDDFEAEPQPETWEHIRAAIQKKKKKRPILWFFFAIGFALLVGIGFYTRTTAKQADAAQPTPRTSTEKTLPTDSGLSSATERTTPQNSVSNKGFTNESAPYVAQKGAGDNGVHHNQPTTRIMNTKSSFEQQENTSQETNNNQPKSLVMNTKTSFEQQENPSQETNNNQPTSLVMDTKAPFGQQENPSLETNNNQPKSMVMDTKTSLEQQENLGQPALENGSGGVVLSPELSTAKVDTQAVAPLDPLDDLEKSKRQKGREGGWTIDFTTLFSYQLTQSRVHEGKIATNISNLPSFDAQRLGTSLAIEYQIPLKKRSDCSIALAWTNLPYRAQYDRASANQVQINFQSNNQYTVKRITESAVNDAYRLNLWGLQLQYGYTFSVLDKKIRVFAGGEGVLYKQSPELWGSAGLNIPLGKSKFQLMPVFKYQFKAMEQPDHLLKTKLYTVGLGIKRII
jgi:FtsZ-interacting cell division protein ZipA